MSLKEILFMFKREQEYAERKNQVIFVVLGIMLTVTSIFSKKMPLSFLPYFYIMLCFTLIINLLSFFPQSNQIRLKLFFTREIKKRKPKKIKNNKFNF